jgi:hypothetical protein
MPKRWVVEGAGSSIGAQARETEGEARRCRIRAEEVERGINVIFPGSYPDYGSAEKEIRDWQKADIDNEC